MSVLDAALLSWQVLSPAPLLSIVIAAVAIAVFVSGGAVAWLQAIVMVPGAAIGGHAGVWAAKRVP